MRVQDLMIGDWVFDKILKSNAKVEALQPLTIISDIHTEHHLYKEFDPVPLTPEILEANGFKLNEKQRTQYGWVINEAHIGDTYFLIHTCEYWAHDPKKYINIWVKWDGYVRPCDYHIMYPTYVHELQHALRLCGLNDLADNFKVE